MAVDPPADGSAPAAGGAVKAVPVAKSYYEIISEDTVRTLSIHLTLSMLHTLSMHHDLSTLTHHQH